MQSLLRVWRNDIGREIYVPGQFCVAYHCPLETGAVSFFLMA